MTHRHTKEREWSCICAELYARNVVGLSEDKVAEVVKEAANRIVMDECPSIALQDAMRYADDIDQGREYQWVTVWTERDGFIEEVE